MEEIVLELKKK